MTSIERNYSMDPPHPGQTYQELLDLERVQVPAPLRERVHEPVPAVRIPRARYISRDFHDLEAEHLWRKCWQFACLASDIPEGGDSTTYDILDESVLLVRAEDGSINAFYNSCPHRGQALRNGPGSGDFIKCPFHGLSWSLDGENIGIPSAWDFHHVEKERLCLRRVRSAVYNGFVFITFDDNAPPFEEFAAGLIRHLDHWDFTKRFKFAHIEKVFRCNWKVAMEAFIESFHIYETHPQGLDYVNDVGTQYDIWPDDPHMNRMLTPFGVQSMHLGPQGDVTEAILSRYGIDISAGSTEIAPEDMRHLSAKGIREAFQAQFGADLSSLTDAETLDAIEYFLFPNFAPWTGLSMGLIYRWRPNGDDHESCIMDVLSMGPVPDEGPVPPNAPVHHLGPDDSFLTVKEINENLAAVFDQDAANLPFVQKGLRSEAWQDVTSADYQEARIRHIHLAIDRQIETALGEGANFAGRIEPA